jgi:hypothetical protein
VCHVVNCVCGRDRLVFIYSGVVFYFTITSTQVLYIKGVNFYQHLTCTFFIENCTSSTFLYLHIRFAILWDFEKIVLFGEIDNSLREDRCHRKLFSFSKCLKMIFFQGCLLRFV